MRISSGTSYLNWAAMRGCSSQNREREQCRSLSEDRSMDVQHFGNPPSKGVHIERSERVSNHDSFSIRFTLLEKHCVEFQQIAMQKPELRKADDVFNRVMIKDNVATVALLENKETQARILTANAHLHWDPAYKDVKLVQTAMLMEELEKLGNTWSRNSGKDQPRSSVADATRLPLIVCGDFNSLPDSGVYEFLSRGRVPQDHEDFGTYMYGPYTSEGLQHKFALKSSYAHVGELEFTNFTPQFKGVIDYVWYSTNALSVTGLLGGVDREYISRTVGFPNAHHPSDHVPLVISMRVKAASAAPVRARFQ